MAVIFKLHVAGKITPVKKFVCYLLIVWMTLVAGGANALAHSADHHAHDALHAHDHSSLATSVESITSQDDFELGADYPEKSSQHPSSHCHTHHQVAGLPSCHGMLPVADLPNCAPAFSQRLVSIAFANNIDRPKWAVTTPAVVSLLS